MFGTALGDMAKHYEKHDYSQRHVDDKGNPPRKGVDQIAAQNLSQHGSYA